MQVCTKISKATIKLILKIIYKISKLYCMWYQDNFSYQAIDLDDLSDQWNDYNYLEDFKIYPDVEEEDELL